MEEVCKLDDFRKDIEDQMKAKEVETKLSGLEKVKKFYLEPEPFTTSNNLLTPTFKIRRGACKMYYAQKI